MVSISTVFHECCRARTVLPRSPATLVFGVEESAILEVAASLKGGARKFSASSLDGRREHVHVGHQRLLKSSGARF